MKIVLVAVAVLVIVAASVVLVAQWRWGARSAELVARVHASTAEGAFDEAQVANLPAPVQRYLRLALKPGQPLFRRAGMRQEGEFLVRPATQGWGPFTATQAIGAHPAGFVWDARIRMSGLSVWVRDAYVDGQGSMRASLLSVFGMVRVEGTPEITKGALQRYLAEGPWCPTVLLPTQGVVWNAVDGRRAVVSIAGTSATVEYRFGPDGLVESVFAPDRPRDIDGHAVPTPWEGLWLEYGERSGMRIPLRGEVAWLLPEGRQTYFKGRVVEVEYE